MELLIVAIVLAGGLAFVIYAVWTYIPKKVIRHDQHHATKSTGDGAMTGMVAGTERERVMRWIEEGRTALETILRMLADLDHLKETLQAARKDGERLAQDCEHLRAELSRAKADRERAERERGEFAQWLTTVMDEAAARLRTEPSPSVTGGSQGPTRPAGITPA